MKQIFFLITIFTGTFAMAEEFYWSHTGPGCPQGSVTLQSNPTSVEKELAFGDLVVNRQGKKQCQLIIRVPGKPQFSYSMDIMKVDFNFWLSKNSISEFSLVSNVNGVRNADHGFVFAGPHFGEGQYQVFDHTQKQWSPCGREAILTIDLNVELHSALPPGDRMMIEKISFPKLISKECP
jgi:hypothetical protein